MDGDDEGEGAPGRLSEGFGEGVDEGRRADG